MTRIVISNAYSFKNKGDGAIVLALIQEIRRVFSNAYVVVQTTDPGNDQDKYGEAVDSSLLWILGSSRRYANIIYRFGWLVYNLVCLWLFMIASLLLKIYWILPKETRKFVLTYEKSDMVLGCGGGYLRTAGSGANETLILYLTGLNFLLAKSFGKPVYLYSQSIGPVHGGIQRRLLKYFLNRVDLIEPRETISLKLLKELQIRTPYHLTADAALLLGDCGRTPEKIKMSQRLRVGLTVRNWFDNVADLQKYIESMAAIIDYLIVDYKAEVFYVPQVIAENYGDDDRVVARRVQERVTNKELFQLIDIDLHPFEVIGLCGQMDVFVGTRMHSNIFALINEVPVIAIEYEHKTRGIMTGLGMERLVINIQDVTFQSLKEKVDDLIKNRRQYTELIHQNLPGQIRRASAAIEIIKEAYERQTI